MLFDAFAADQPSKSTRTARADTPCQHARALRLQSRMLAVPMPSLTTNFVYAQLPKTTTRPGRDYDRGFTDACRFRPSDCINAAGPGRRASTSESRRLLSEGPFPGQAGA